MAIWQFAMLAVPAQRIRSRFGDYSLLTAEDLLDEDSLHGVTETVELQTALSRILPAAPSWSPVVRKWGDIEGDDVTLVFEEEVLQEVAIRIDVRTSPERLIDEIASLGQDQDWLFISDSGRVLPPTMDALRQEIAHSEAARFVSDPEAFLDQLGND